MLPSEEEVLLKQIIDGSHLVDAVSACARDYIPSRVYRDLKLNWSKVEQITIAMDTFFNTVKDLMANIGE